MLYTVIVHYLIDSLTKWLAFIFLSETPHRRLCQSLKCLLIYTCWYMAKSRHHNLPEIQINGFGAELMATVYPKKYAHGFVVLCFVVVMQSFIMNSHEVFIHIHQGCFAGTGAIVRLPQCQWSKPDGYGKISQCITTTKHSKAKTVCIFLGIYCKYDLGYQGSSSASSCVFPVVKFYGLLIWRKCTAT